MLRHAGVRSKFLAVLAIPVVLLVAATALLVAGQAAAARRAGQVNAMTEVALQANRVVHALQEERSATLGYLQDGSVSNRTRMLGQRRDVDQQVATLREKLAASPVEQMPESVTKAVSRSASAHSELRSARRSIDHQVFFGTDAGVFFDKVIHTDLGLPGAVAESGTRELAQRLRAYEALSSTIEYAARERDMLEGAYLRGYIFETEYAQSGGLVAQQQQTLQEFQQIAPPELVAELDRALDKAEIFSIDSSRRQMAEMLQGGEPDVGAATEWVMAANTRLVPMVATESQLVADIATTAAATQDEETRQALLLAVAALFGLALAIVLAVGLANRIAQPLRRLTVAAGEIGDELPHMVERMQTPGEGPGVEVEPISVESRDEIGRLAEAFNTVNEVTVRVAREQAALRASIAEMFVNVARRNQVLLSRQLAQIDRMEAREEDPDLLDNLFKLDHLATRMRRNAESLLVLAGIDATRRLRQPMPLSDVVRTAVSEIEAFDRVDLAMSQDPDVSGRLSLTTAHLLAELLENATHFSNPETRVVVSAAVTGHGVDLTITDYGLGMSEEEVAEANARIADPPVAEIAVSQRLGLLVVGRLAQRLGATVSLRRGRTAGTVVTVALPDSVFEGLARPEPAAPAEPEVEDAVPVVVADVVEVVVAVDVAEAVEAVEPAEPEVEAASADEREPVAAPAPKPLPEPEPMPLPEPEPEPGPTPVFAFAPAIDVLPGRPMTNRPSARPSRPDASDVPSPRPAEPAAAPERLPAFEPIPASHQPRAKAPAAALSASPPAQPPAEADYDPARREVDAETASNALSELRGLYAPAFAPRKAREPASTAGLSRRTPKPASREAGAAATTTTTTTATAVGEPAAPTATRQRTASEVRGMLSGFRAGVERGRTVPDDPPAADSSADSERRNNQP